MAKSYNISNVESQTVSEPAVAYSYNNRITPIHPEMLVDRGSITTAITGQELKARLHEKLKLRL